MSDDPIDIAEGINERAAHWKGDPHWVILARALLASEAARKVAESERLAQIDVADNWAIRFREAEARCERMREALEDAWKWINEECQPDAEFAGQGHNWCMSNEDRVRAREILIRCRSALAVAREGP